MTHILYVLIVILFACPTWAGEPVAPTAPTAVDYSVAATTEDVTVTSGSVVDLAAKIAAMECGQHILLPVATYTLTSQITIPDMAEDCLGEAVAAGQSAIAGSSGAHAVAGASGLSASASTSSGDHYVIIDSANYASLPAAGTRIDPDTDVANMPTIILPSVSSNGAFRTGDGAHHVIFRGLHVKPISTTCTACGLTIFQSPSATTDVSTWPHHIYIERSYLQGASGGGTLRGAHMLGSNMGVVDSVIKDIFVNGTSSDRQGVLLNGGGPFLVRNNTLNADSETIMMGDNAPPNYDMDLGTHDVTITNNFLYRPLSWSPYSTAYPLTLAVSATTTAAIDAGGTCVTLTGKTPEAAWANGIYYFLATADKNGSGWYDEAKLITAVGACNGANSLTLTSAHSRVSESGLTYRISYWNGVKTGGSTKNHIECKQCRRVLIEGNVFRNISNGNQFTTFVMTPRGSGGTIQDLDIQNNYIKDTVVGLNLAARPSASPSNNFAIAGDGTTNCSGGPCVQITYTGGVLCDCATGDTIQILRANDASIGTDEAKGIWALTRVSNSVITIPVPFVNAHTGTGTSAGGSINIFHAGGPTARIRVKNNVFEEPGSYQMFASDSAQSGKAIFVINGWPTFTTSDGSDDDALSNTGEWNPKDYNFEHNTCVAPVGTNIANRMLEMNEGGSPGYDYASDVPMTNFTWRSNVCPFSGEGNTASNYGVLGGQNSLSGSSFNLQGADNVIDAFSDASQNWSNNVFYKNGTITLALEYSKSADSNHVNNAIVADKDKVGFTSFTSGTPTTLSNFTLTNLFTTGTCSTSTANLNVTCSDTMPATVVKGTPFKINSDGSYCMVDTVSGTSLTLRANVGSCTTGYPSTNNNAAFTLGFKGWGHDGTDPGANMTTLMDAISGVARSITGVTLDP
jgi:hypothetical protein